MADQVPITPAALLLEELATLLEALPDGLVLVDPDGRIALVNHRLTALTGFDAGELLGAPVEVLVPVGVAEEHRHRRHAVLAGGTDDTMDPGAPAVPAVEHGRALDVEVSVERVRLHGRPHLVAVVRDVSRRREAEARLRAMEAASALADERERIARALHDDVIQELYGLGIGLESVVGDARGEVAERIAETVEALDEIMRRIRTTIFQLRPPRLIAGSVRTSIAHVADEAARALGFHPVVVVDGPVDAVIEPDLADDVLAVIREGLTNVARHARATRAEVMVAVGAQLAIEVRDDGTGPGTQSTDEPAAGGVGLANLQVRATRRGGQCELLPRPSGGSVLRWRVPMSAAR